MFRYLHVKVTLVMLIQWCLDLDLKSTCSIEINGRGIPLLQQHIVLLNVCGHTQRLTGSVRFCNSKYKCNKSFFLIVNNMFLRVSIYYLSKCCWKIYEQISIV